MGIASCGYSLLWALGQQGRELFGAGGAAGLLAGLGPSLDTMDYTELVRSTVAHMLLFNWNSSCAVPLRYTNIAFQQDWCTRGQQH